ncbi:MAG: hypothetical protein ACREUQ_03680 [Burkholderiales bacterium]
MVSIGASAVRNQGTKLVANQARKALMQLNLRSFATDDRSAFFQVLDEATREVESRLPSCARSWGIARKCLNIYLRDCLYNVYLRHEFDLTTAEPYLEVPLDGVVVEQLKRYYPTRSLPRWFGVKHLLPEESTLFQDALVVLADFLDVAPVHLDTILWVEGRG